MPFRLTLPPKNSQEVADLSALLGKIGLALGRAEAATHRNANGVYMKMMNFRRFDPEYTSEGKIGLSRGNKEEEGIWAEFFGNTVGLAAAVAAIRAVCASGIAAGKKHPARRGFAKFQR